MSNQTSDNNKRIAKNTMIYDKIMNKLKGIQRMFAYNIKNILLNGIASSVFTPPILQRWIYNSLGYAIHKTSRIYPQCFCGNGKGKLKVGANSYINYRCFLDLGNDIIIGNNVSIAFNCTFINSTHEIGDDNQRAGLGVAKKIILEDGCWIGAHTTILPGVRIAKGCVIGANSLITKDTEKNGLYVGAPAIRIKTI